MSSRTAARIAVLMGGRSAEREVSLVSGRECAAALRQEGFEVVEIDAGPDLASALAAATAGRRLQRAARPLGRGRLRPGHPRVAATSPTPIPACWPRRWPWTRPAPSRSSPPPGCRWRAGMIVCREQVRARASDAAALCGQAEQRGLVGRGLHRRRRAPTGRRSSPTTCPRRVLVEEYVAGRELTDDGDGRPGAGRHRHHRRRLVRLSRRSTRRAARGTWCRRTCRRRSPRPASTMRSARTEALGCRGVSRTDFRWDEARGLAGLDPPRDQHPAGHDADLAGAGAGGACGMSLRRRWCAGWWRTPRAPGEGAAAAATRRRRGCATG